MTNHNGNFVTLYSSIAHVFQVNPETKNSWLPKCEQAMPISFVASTMSNDPEKEPSKRELKIIGIGDNGENVFSATILPKTTFTKRSQKFGQWTDHTGTVYGLGFNSDAELTEFIETFQQLQHDILSTQSSTQAQQQPNHHFINSTSNSQSLINLEGDISILNHQKVNNGVSETNGRLQAQNRNGGVQPQLQHQQYANTLAHPGHQQQQAKYQQQQQQLAQINNGDGGLNNSDAVGLGSTSNNNSMSQVYPKSQSMFGLQNKANNLNNTVGRMAPAAEAESSTAEWQIRDQLKYENERLKQALEENSKNSGMWHNELLNLRTNNVKLTQALQESKAHVEEWERELLSLRNENKELKLRVMALESVNDPGRDDSHKDLQKYKSYVDEVQIELRKKETEIEELQRSMEELKLKATTGLSADGQADHSAQISSSQKQKFIVINAKLEAKLCELGSVQKEFSHLLDTLSNN